MSALEEEIISKFQLLDKEAQLRLLNRLETPREKFDWQAWLQRVEAFQAELRAQNKSGSMNSIQDIIDEVRLERLNDILGSL